MSYDLYEEPTIEDELCARTIGREVLRWARNCDLRALARQVDTDAVLLLKEIQRILDNDTLDDAECFYRIDAIVSAFHQAGLSTTRHWELE